MDRLKAFFTTYRRRLIQVTAAVAYNLNLKGFVTGTISKSPTKAVCVPGLNCYSCPGAVGACPLGSLQAALGGIPNKLPLYVVGTLLLFGIFLGRAICAFLCPLGFIQELLYKIPTKKLKKSKWTRRLSALKYILLAVFVIALPLWYLVSTGVASPAFCKFICPAGTLEGGVPLLLLNPDLREAAGGLFVWKLILLAAFLISSVFVYRPFCRFICPLGAIYSFFNRAAVFGVRVEQSRCIDCGRCVAHCEMDVKRVNDRECIRCGSCKSVCPVNAIVSRGVPRKGTEGGQKQA